MVSARGDALEWALALARAPAERMLLRQRPLPDGIEPLLQIAAGHGGEALSDAISSSGETEESLVDAVRFYLREVLFHSGADAYRILGLERGASDDRIKAHHRWLQQWLHPDRHTSDWDAIFAGRVNAAWNQLRNAERRRAYDAEHPAGPVAQVPAQQTPVIAHTAGWLHPVAEPTLQARWQGRMPFLALLVACAGLGLLALRDIARDEALVAASPGGIGDDADGQRRGQADRLELFERLQLPSKASQGKTAPAAKMASAQPERAPRELRKPAARVIADVPREPSAPKPSVVQATAALPVTPPIRSATAEPSTPPARIPRAVAVAESSTTKPPPSASAPIVTRPEPSPPPPVAAAPAPAVAVASSPTGPQPEVSALKVRQAQQVGDRLLAFMNRRSAAVPPIWDSLAAQNGAGQLREELLDGGKAGFSEPSWRVGGQDAQLRVDVVYPDGREGRLAAGLVWREQRWLVSRLSMERDW